MWALTEAIATARPREAQMLARAMAVRAVHNQEGTPMLHHMRHAEPKNGADAGAELESQLATAFGADAAAKMLELLAPETLAVIAEDLAAAAPEPAEPEAPPAMTPAQRGFYASLRPRERDGYRALLRSEQARAFAIARGPYGRPLTAGEAAIDLAMRGATAPQAISRNPVTGGLEFSHLGEPPRSEEERSRMMTRLFGRRRR